MFQIGEFSKNKGIRKDVKILRQVRDTETKGAERLIGVKRKEEFYGI